MHSVGHSVSLLFNQKKPDMKERVEKPKKTVKPAAPNRPHPAGRRPQRAAATSTKSYKEPDTDDSQSESENPPVSKAKDFPISYATFSFYKCMNCLSTFETLLNK